MADEVNAEFVSYRRTLQTEEKKWLFDEKIKYRDGSRAHDERPCLPGPEGSEER
jgi:hypothetical protein